MKSTVIRRKGRRNPCRPAGVIDIDIKLRCAWWVRPALVVYAWTFAWPGVWCGWLSSDQTLAGAERIIRAGLSGEVTL